MSKDHGRFIWCELMTPDVAGATRFYGAVVGWTAHELPDPDGVYTRVEADGEYGDGIRGQEQCFPPDPDAPSHAPPRLIWPTCGAHAPVPVFHHSPTTLKRRPVPRP